MWQFMSDGDKDEKEPLALGPNKREKATLAVLHQKESIVLLATLPPNVVTLVPITKLMMHTSPRMYKRWNMNLLPNFFKFANNGSCRRMVHVCGPMQVEISNVEGGDEQRVRTAGRTPQC